MRASTPVTGSGVNYTLVLPRAVHPRRFIEEKMSHRTCVYGVAFTSLVAFGCQEPNTFQPPPPPEVTVAAPVEQMVEAVKEYSGVTQPVERVEIRARVEGFLEEISFTEGDDIEAGQLLFVIDPRPFQANLDAAQAALRVANSAKTSALANLKQAQAQAANDQAQYDRAARAARSGAVTEAELDELRTARDNSIAGIDVARASIDSADAQIAVSEASLRQSELDYDYTQIRSPITGRVGQQMVDLGNLVGSGESTLLTTVITYDPIYVSFTVSEADYLQFARKALEQNDGVMPSGNDRPDREIRIGLADEEGFPHIGKFSYADLAVDQSSGTYLVRAVIPNPSRLIPPGAFVRVQVPDEPESVMLVDEAALGRDQNGAYVTVVGPDDTAGQKRVTAGRLFEGKRVIKSGLTASDRVVINGVQKARPGAKVRPQAPPATPTEEASE